MSESEGRETTCSWGGPEGPACWNVGACGCRVVTPPARETTPDGRLARYETALRRIANEDYRGGRPWSAQIAQEALAVSYTHLTLPTN